MQSYSNVILQNENMVYLKKQQKVTKFEHKSVSSVTSLL